MKTAEIRLPLKVHFKIAYSMKYQIAFRCGCLRVEYVRTYKVKYIVIINLKARERT